MVLAQYSQDELFYEATVVKKVDGDKSGYVVIFAGYDTEEVSLDVRDISASLSEFDIGSDDEVGTISREEVVSRKNSVMNDLIRTLSKRNTKVPGAVADSIPKTNSKLANLAMDRPKLPGRRRKMKRAELKL